MSEDDILLTVPFFRRDERVCRTLWPQPKHPPPHFEHLPPTKQQPNRLCFTNGSGSPGEQACLIGFSEPELILQTGELCDLLVPLAPPHCQASRGDGRKVTPFGSNFTSVWAFSPKWFAAVRNQARRLDLHKLKVTPRAGFSHRRSMWLSNIFSICLPSPHFHSAY